MAMRAPPETQPHVRSLRVFQTQTSFFQADPTQFRMRQSVVTLGPCRCWLLFLLLLLLLSCRTVEVERYQYVTYELGLASLTRQGFCLFIEGLL